MRIRFLGALGALGLAALALGPVALSMSGEARADAGFQRWVRDFRSTALSNGVSGATYDRAFAGVTEPDASVLRAASHQPEFTRAIWDYLDSAVSDTRLTNGRRMLERYRGVLDVIEARYGVDRHIVVAIWGMESSYGAVLDNHDIVKPVIRSLATLAYGDSRRARFGREQLLAALRILERGHTTPDRMTGSWAGAMGHTQFIPTTYLSYAADYEGDGRIDIWDNPADALASTAHYLARSGWVTGHTWGYEVEIPAGFDWRLADESTERSLAEWQRIGLRRTGGRTFPRPEDTAKLIAPAGSGGPVFLMLRNFDVIKRYNNATSYALAVGHLADRLAGYPAFASSWPRSSRPLSRSDTEELQRLLTRRGYDTGGADGRIGPNTRRAIRSYQAAAGLTPDGYADSRLLSRLRGG
ncbi:MAG: lytic murein transglycosylase [Hyphomicrobiaceae bacterium]|nr:lytic murein transglycosylase [Hyphomicrobiaceae bacterium]